VLPPKAILAGIPFDFSQGEKNPALRLRLKTKHPQDASATRTGGGKPPHST